MTKSPGDLPRKHARMYGSPGEGARFAGVLRAVWPLLGVVLFAGYLIRALAPYPAMGQMGVGGGFVVLAIVSFFVLGRCSLRVGAYMKGARGEERVASTLAFLSSEYVVFNGLSLDRVRLISRGRDFDHIVIGPTGIFVVETKNWGSSVVYREGRLLYEDGKEPSRPPLVQVHSAVASLKALLLSRLDLDLPVHSVVCFVGNRFVNGRHELPNTTICNLNDLLSVIVQSRGKSLEAGTAERVSALLTGWVVFEADEVASVAKKGEDEPPEVSGGNPDIS